MSSTVWILLQLRDGKLHRMAREAITAGQALAAAVEGRASAVILGHETEEASREAAAYDLDAVWVADDAKLTDYTPGAFIGTLVQAIQGAEAGPDYLVAPHTYQSVDFVPRLGQQLDAAVVPEAVSFETGGDGLVFRRPIMGGKLQARVRARGEGLTVVTVQSGVFSASDATAGSADVRPLAIDFSAVASDREILGVEQVGGDQVDLSKAEIVVAVGRGVGGEDKMQPIHDLAEALGADIGASRPVIDNGWLPRDRQIGSSGQTVAPKLYVAAGISGAIQHLVGMKSASCVVAINKDASAPIFSVAQYGLVGDLHEILPVLTEAVKAAKAG